jgi:hypothetical protein
MEQCRRAHLFDLFGKRRAAQLIGDRTLQPGGRQPMSSSAFFIEASRQKTA